MTDHSASASKDAPPSTSPKLGAKQASSAVKKEKNKYQAFKSDDDDSTDVEETDFRSRKNKVKREKPNASFKVKIIGMKPKKKEKDKDKEKEKKKKVKKAANTSDETVQEAIDEPAHKPVFGVPLDVAVDRSAYPDRIALPRVVRDCILYVEEKGLSEEGLYRISGVKSRIDQLKQLFNQGKEINIEDYDPNCVASVLKLYLRELPSNILTTRLAPIFDAYISCESSEDQLAKYQQLIHDLPCPNRTLLGWLFTHFSHVLEKGSENKMNIQNISIVFSPTMSISHGVLNLFFQFTKDLFPDVQLLKYIPADGTEEEEPCEDMIIELETTLRENEELLNELHDRINQGEENQKVMDELWERQRKSTQLKRKIKTLKKKLNAKKTNTDSSMSKEDLTPSLNSLISENTKVETKVVPVPVPIPVDEPQKNELSQKLSARSMSIEDTVEEQDNMNLKRSRKPIQQENAWTAEIIKSTEPPPDDTPEVEQPVEPTTNLKKSASTGSLVNNNEKDNSRRHSMDELNSVNYDTKDSELEALLIEEQQLTIENEELSLINNELNQQIAEEKKNVANLKDKLENQQNSLHSSLSSSSSKSSISSSSENSSTLSSGDIQHVNSFEEISNLELKLEQLEEENKKLENHCDEIIDKILYERQEIVKYKTNLRLKYIYTAVK